LRHQASVYGEIELSRDKGVSTRARRRLKLTLAVGLSVVCIIAPMSKSRGASLSSYTGAVSVTPDSGNGADKIVVAAANDVIYAENFSGSTPNAKINNALAAVTYSGQTVDATGVSCATRMAAPIVLTGPVKILMPLCHLQCPAAGSPSGCIQLPANGAGDGTHVTCASQPHWNGNDMGTGCWIDNEPASGSVQPAIVFPGNRAYNYEIDNLGFKRNALSGADILVTVASGGNSWSMNHIHDIIDLPVSAVTSPNPCANATGVCNGFHGGLTYGIDILKGGGEVTNNVIERFYLTGGDGGIHWGAQAGNSNVIRDGYIAGYFGGLGLLPAINIDMCSSGAVRCALNTTIENIQVTGANPVAGAAVVVLNGGGEFRESHVEGTNSLRLLATPNTIADVSACNSGMGPGGDMTPWLIEEDTLTGGNGISSSTDWPDYGLAQCASGTSLAAGTGAYIDDRNNKLLDYSVDGTLAMGTLEAPPGIDYVNNIYISSAGADVGGVDYKSYEPGQYGPNNTNISKCGTSPALASGSSPRRGIIQPGSGTVTSCTMNFGVQWPRSPYCLCAAMTGASAPETCVVTNGPLNMLFTLGGNVAGGRITYDCGY